MEPRVSGRAPGAADDLAPPQRPVLHGARAQRGSSGLRHLCVERDLARARTVASQEACVVDPSQFPPTSTRFRRSGSRRTVACFCAISQASGRQHQCTQLPCVRAGQAASTPGDAFLVSASRHNCFVRHRCVATPRRGVGPCVIFRAPRGPNASETPDALDGQRQEQEPTKPVERRLPRGRRARQSVLELMPPIHPGDVYA